MSLFLPLAGRCVWPLVAMCGVVFDSGLGLNVKAFVSMKILIVARRKVDLCVLQGLFAPLGFDVATADSLVQMEQFCLRQLFDVVVSVGFDWLACGRDAVLMFRGRCGMSRVVVLSGSSDEQAVLGAIESGVNQYLSLPVEPCRLRRKLCCER